MSEAYHWLVYTGGLWYAVVGWAVAWIMGLAVAWRPFKKHMKTQQEQTHLLREIKYHVSRPSTPPDSLH